MSTNEKAHDPSHGWYDTVNVPARGETVIRIHVTGKTVVHCGVPHHEDRGMMAVLDIVRNSEKSGSIDHKGEESGARDNRLANAKPAGLVAPSDTEHAETSRWRRRSYRWVVAGFR